MHLLLVIHNMCTVWIVYVTSRFSPSARRSSQSQDRTWNFQKRSQNQKMPPTTQPLEEVKANRGGQTWNSTRTLEPPNASSDLSWQMTSAAMCKRMFLIH